METSYGDLGGILGLLDHGTAHISPLHLIDRIRQGLPVRVLYTVSNQIAPDDSKFVFRIVPKASLARRKKGLKPLTADESNRIARLAAVWKLAETVWKNDEEARAFLFRPHPMLEGRRPIDVVLESELGAELVRNILGRLLYGSAA